MGYERLVVVGKRALGAAVISVAAALFSAAPAGAASSCGKVTSTLISSTLGLAVPAPTEVHNGRVLECVFGQPGPNARSLVTVELQTDVSPAKFKSIRAVFGKRATTTFSGLGLPAFSSVQGAGSARVTGLAVLKGSTVVDVFWGGPITKIAALVRKILPTA